MDADLGFQALMLSAGAACGIVAVTAGGGVTLGVPLLMLAGLPAGTSVIAIKVALWTAFLTGSIAHVRNRPESAVRTPWWLWPFCLAGAVCGARLLTELDPQKIQGIVLAMLLVSTAGSIWATRSGKDVNVAPSSAQRVTGFLAIVILAVYSGFFGAGYGVFLIWILVGLHGHSPVSAAALGTRLSLAISTASVSVFVIQGDVPWPIAIPLTIGCALGGLIGAKATKKLGNRFIRAAIWVASILAGLKLLASP